MVLTGEEVMCTKRGRSTDELTAIDRSFGTDVRGGGYEGFPGAPTKVVAGGGGAWDGVTRTHVAITRLGVDRVTITSSRVRSMVVVAMGGVTSRSCADVLETLGLEWDSAEVGWEVERDMGIGPPVGVVHITEVDCTLEPSLLECEMGIEPAAEERTVLEPEPDSEAPCGTGTSGWAVVSMASGD